MNAHTAHPSEAAPTLELRQFALRSAGAAWTTPLSLRSDAQRIGLVGDWEPLFQLLTGSAEDASGSAKILGYELEHALSRGVLGFAACDPPLPTSFTVSEYLRHAARLTHGSASRARHDATRALDRYGLSELGERKISQLATYQRRALGIALSTLNSPPVVYLEGPLRDLDAPSADYIARLCIEAGARGRVILSAALPVTPSPERSLLDTCDELFLRKQGALVAQGAPSSVFTAGARYLLTVKGPNIPDFSRALREAGLALEERARVGSFKVELPAGASGTTDTLLDAALAHGLIVLELEPLFTV